MPDFHFTNFLSGPNVNVGIFGLEDSGLTQLNGCLISHELGTIMKDVGYSRIGNAALEASKTITGLHNFRQNASTQKMLATCNDSGDDDTQLFYSTGGNWTEIAAAETAWANEANGKVEMEDFASYCYFVGYDSTDGFLPPRSLTNTTFGTTNTTSMPNAKYIKRFRDRLYLGNCDIGGTAYPYRVYFSSVPSGATITWTTATDFFDVDYSEEITGLGENWDLLMVFTEFSAYRYDQLSKKKVWDVGCSNHRTIKNNVASMFWANRDGVWESVNGSYPNNIAGRMLEFIRAGNPRNFFGELVDEEYWLYVGTVTVKGITYTNCAIIYDIPTQTWRWREFHDDIKAFSEYNSSGELRLWMGDDSGMIWEKVKHTDSTLYYGDAIITSDAGAQTDLVGKPIASQFETKLLDFGNPAVQKVMREITAYTERAGNLKIMARIVDTNNRITSKYQSIGGLRGFINNMLAGKVRKGHFLQISGTEHSTKPYWSLYGFSVNVDPFRGGKKNKNAQST